MIEQLTDIDGQSRQNSKCVNTNIFKGTEYVLKAVSNSLIPVRIRKTHRKSLIVAKSLDFVEEASDKAAFWLPLSTGVNVRGHVAPRHFLPP